jgi:hypothetical protein
MTERTTRTSVIVAAGFAAIQEPAFQPPSWTMPSRMAIPRTCDRLNQLNVPSVTYSGFTGGTMCADAVHVPNARPDTLVGR